ncbi:hypothetical protein MPH_00155 [Macrophomina phaseolina MS6]|uniref:Ankyrin repeat-containing domain protein n=1 Tax=Macrophomina phaseolina (strain MS6) TaxID=1126212 RepID=K2RIM8_MACPH|nr:hypothetical protein MPH_00155 [Macrophomina phaseolina MS6]
MASPDEHHAQLNEKHQLIMDTCRSGDLGALQQLFIDCNITEGYPPVQPRGDLAKSPAPVTADLLETAVGHKHPEIVAFLLKTILTSTLSSCCTPTNPTSCSTNSTRGGALSEACDGGRTDPTIPDYLLDHGAAASEATGGPRGAPLGSAILGGQPVQLIQKMVAKGVPVSGIHVTLCLTARRADALQVLLESPSLRLSQEDAKKHLERVKEMGDDKLTAAISNHIEKAALGEKSEKRKWWAVFK